MTFQHSLSEIWYSAALGTMVCVNIRGSLTDVAPPDLCVIPLLWGRDEHDGELQCAGATGGCLLTSSILCFSCPDIRWDGEFRRPKTWTNSQADPLNQDLSKRKLCSKTAPRGSPTSALHPLPPSDTALPEPGNATFISCATGCHEALDPG